MEAFGCSANIADAEIIKGILCNYGYELTSIRKNFLGFFFTIMNQIYNARQSTRREEMEDRTLLQHCLYMATELNYVVWTDLDMKGDWADC